MGWQEDVVSCGYIQSFSGFVFEDGFALYEGYSLVFVLVVPLSFRGSLSGGDDALYPYVVGSDEIEYVFVVGERVREIEEVEGHVVLHWRHIESMGKYGIARC